MEAVQTVELHPRKIEELNNAPALETFMWVSDDGKWFVHKTIITDIKPMTYMDQVFEKEAN